MAIDVRRISWWDTVRLQAFVTIPAALWGLVAPNRFFVACLSKWNLGQATIRFLSDLRHKYSSDHLWVLFPLGKTLLVRTLLVLDPESVAAVLRSEKNDANPLLKKYALSRFAPDAVVISSGVEWEERRRFNESVLDFDRLHRHGDTFKEVVFREVDRLAARNSGIFRWTDFQTLGQRISHQVILGPGHVRPELAMQLARMLRRSNWLLRHRRSFAAFYEQIERRLARHREFHADQSSLERASGEPVATNCLLHESARLLEVRTAASQIGFWFFVLKDALELHVARTLALIAVHPEVQKRVRADIGQVATSSAQAINELRYLDACIGEQLRLWTPVPILLRRAVHCFSLPGEITIKKGQQILIHAGFYHRDPRVFERADMFSPDLLATAPFPRVYFFSGHRQSCAGESLARFLLKATLAALLAKFRFELVGPPLENSRIPCSYDHFKIELRALGDGAAAL